MEENKISNDENSDNSIENIIKEYDKGEVSVNTDKPAKAKKGRRLKKALIIILCVILAIIIALVSTFFILTYIGKNQFHKDDTHINNEAVIIEDDNTVVYKDKKYALNENLVSILVMGIDRENINENLGVGNNGQADVIFVATIDTKTKKANIIPISRETLTDISIYTQGGKYVGTEKQQICLAYAYGSTAQQSSENVMQAVKRMLYGININSYVTIELEGIAQLSEMVGGVPVTCIEDYKYGINNYKVGQQLNLKGKEAIRYIQYRSEDLNSNSLRMQRQKQFLSALINEVGNEIMNDFTNLPKFYNELAPYYSSNVSLPQLTYLAKECLTMNFGDLLNYKSIDGTLNMGEKWVEFIPNEDSILQTVIDVFYIPVS